MGWSSECSPTADVMETLPNWDQLKRHVATVSRNAPGYTSNMYSAPAQVELWCAAARLRVLVCDRAVLLLRADRDLHHVYHVAEDVAALREALGSLPFGRYVVDLVGQEEALEQVCAAYRAAGFAAHTWLRRMSRVQTPGMPVGDGAEPGRLDDAGAVMCFLERLLDPRAEQLPDRFEIDDAIAAGHLLVVRGGAAIEGVLMFDLTGQLAHLRFWHVEPAAHGRGIGRALMTGFLARVATARRIVLWVIGSNDRSIAIYRHYGFAADGLLDRIMVLDKD